MEGYHHQFHQQMMGGGEAATAAAGDRFPQWSAEETTEFLVVRAELDRAFMETKRNKLLWEVTATRLKEKGFNRTAEQCKSKWKNLVTRYKGSETMEPEAMRQQFPYYNELHAIFSARMHHMLWAETEGSTAVAITSGPTSSITGKKRKTIVTTSDQISSDNDDVKEREIEDEDNYGKHIGSRKSGGKKKKKKQEKDHEGGLIEKLEVFMWEQEKMEARWRETWEAREEERRQREEKWRKTMAALEEERRRMERNWWEREEQRRLREEARAIKRDALITQLLNRLRTDD